MEEEKITAVPEEQSEGARKKKRNSDGMIGRVHKRAVMYIALYVTLAVFTIVFITTSFVLENVFLQKLTATLIILWLPLVFFTILTHLPQTIAGNLFMYMKLRDTEKRREKFTTYCSGDFVGTEMYETLLNSPDYVKIKTVKVDRAPKDKGDKNQYFTVVLKNLETYRVTVVKRNKAREHRYTTTYVVSDIVRTDLSKKKKKKKQLPDDKPISREELAETPDISAKGK